MTSVRRDNVSATLTVAVAAARVFAALVVALAGTRTTFMAR